MLIKRLDHLSPEHRSWTMSRVRSKNTKPEIAVRKTLHALGYRFRLNVKDLPGTPDIVLPKWKTVIFVNGCFWHRHKGCPRSSTPKSNRNFWIEKFKKNVKRDKVAYRELKKRGWNVIIVWECQIDSFQFKL